VLLFPTIDSSHFEKSELPSKGCWHGFKSSDKRDWVCRICRHRDFKFRKGLVSV